MKTLSAAAASILTGALLGSATVSSPEAPLETRCTAVAAVDGRLVAACAVGVSLRDEASGACVGHLVLPGGALDVAAAGRLALLSLGPNGLAVVDLGEDDEESAAPRLLSIWTSPGAVYQAAPFEGETGRETGGRLWVAADGARGLALLEIGSRGRVRELARLDPGHAFVGVTAGPGGAILACAGEAGLVALRVTEGRWVAFSRLPTAEAREVALLPPEEGPAGAPRAVAADGKGGVALVAVEPGGLRLLDRLPPMGLDRCRGVGVAGDLVLSAEGTSGARLLRVQNDRLLEIERWDDLPGAVADGVIEEGPEPRAILASDREGVILLDLPAIPADSHRKSAD